MSSAPNAELINEYAVLLEDKKQVLLSWINYRVDEWNEKLVDSSSNGNNRLAAFTAFPDFLRRHKTVEKILLPHILHEASGGMDYEHENLLKIEKLAACVSLVRTFIYPSGQPLDRFKLDKAPFIIDSDSDVVELLYEICLQDVSGLSIEPSLAVDIGSLKVDLVTWLKSCKELIHLYSETTPITQNWYMNGQFVIEVLRSFDSDLARISPIDPENNTANLMTAYKLASEFFKVPRLFETCQCLSTDINIGKMPMDKMEDLFLLFAFLLRRQIKLRLLKDRYKQTAEALSGYFAEHLNEIKAALDDIDLCIKDWPADNNSRVLLQKFTTPNGTNIMESHLETIAGKKSFLYGSLMIDQAISKKFVLVEADSTILAPIDEVIAGLALRLRDLAETLQTKMEFLRLIIKRQSIINEQMTQLIILKNKISTDLQDDKTLLPEYELKLAYCEQNAEVGLEIELINYLLTSDHEFVYDIEKFREISFEDPSPLSIEMNSAKESLMNEAKKISKARGSELFDMDVERVTGLITQVNAAISKLFPESSQSYLEKFLIPKTKPKIFTLLKNMKSCILQMKAKECKNIETNLNKMRDHGLKLVGKPNVGAVDVASTQRKLDNDFISLQKSIDSNVEILEKVMDGEELVTGSNNLLVQINSLKSRITSLALEKACDQFAIEISQVREIINRLDNQVIYQVPVLGKLKILDERSTAMQHELEVMSKFSESVEFRNVFHSLGYAWISKTRSFTVAINEMYQKVLSIPLAELKVGDPSFAEKFEALKHQCESCLNETTSNLTPEIEKLLKDYTSMKSKSNNQDDLLFLDEASHDQRELEKGLRNLDNVLEERMSYINGFGKVRTAYLLLVEVEREIEPIFAEIEHSGLLEESNYNNKKMIVQACIQKLNDWSDNIAICIKFNHQPLNETHEKLCEQSRKLYQDIEKQAVDSTNLNSFRAETDALLKEIQQVHIEASNDHEKLLQTLLIASDNLKNIDEHLQSLEIKFDTLPMYREHMLKLGLRCQDDLREVKKICAHKLVEINLHGQIKPHTFLLFEMLETLKNRYLKFIAHFDISDLVAWMHDKHSEDSCFGMFAETIIAEKLFLDSIDLKPAPEISEEHKSAPVFLEYSETYSQLTVRIRQLEQLVSGTALSLEQLKQICKSNISVNQRNEVLTKKVKELYETNDAVTIQRRTVDFVQFAQETTEILNEHIKILTTMENVEESAFRGFGVLISRLVKTAETTIRATNNEKLGIEESKQIFKTIEDKVEFIHSQFKDMHLFSTTPDPNTEMKVKNQFQELKAEFYSIELESIKLPKKYNVQILMGSIDSTWLYVLELAVRLLDNNELIDLIKQRIQTFVHVISSGTLVAAHDHTLQINDDITAQSHYLLRVVKTCNDQMSRSLNGNTEDVNLMIEFSDKLMDNLAVRMRISTNLCVLHRKLFVLIRTLKEACSDNDRLLKLQLDLDILKNEFNSVTSSNLIPVQSDDRKMMEDFTNLFNVLLAAISNSAESYLLLLNMKENYSDKVNRVNTVTSAEEIAALIVTLKLAEYESRLNSVLIENSILIERLSTLNSWKSYLVPVFAEKEEFKIISSIVVNLSESGLQNVVRSIARLKNSLEEILNDHIPYHERLTAEFDAFLNQSISELRTFKNVVDLERGIKFFEEKKAKMITQIQSWQMSIQEHFNTRPMVLLDLESRLTSKMLKLDEIPQLNRSLYDIAAKAKDLVISTGKTISRLTFKLNQISVDAMIDLISEIEIECISHSNNVVSWENFVESESSKNNIISLKDTFIFSKWNPKIRESVTNFAIIKCLAESIVKSHQNYIQIETEMERSLDQVVQVASKDVAAEELTYRHFLEETIRYREFFAKLRQDFGPQNFADIQILKDMVKRYLLISEKLASTVMDDPSTSNEIKESLKANNELQKVSFELDDFFLIFEGLSCFKYMDIPSQALRTNFANVGENDLSSLGSELQTAIAACSKLADSVLLRLESFKQCIPENRLNSKAEIILNSFANLHSSINYRIQEFREILKFIDLVDKMRSEIHQIQIRHYNPNNQALQHICEDLRDAVKIYDKVPDIISIMAGTIEIIESMAKIENESSKQRSYPSSRDLIISVELFIEKLAGDVSGRAKDIFKAVFAVSHNNVRCFNAIIFEANDFINETSRAYNRKLSQIDVERFNSWYEKLSSKVKQNQDSWSEKVAADLVHEAQLANDLFLNFKGRLHESKLPYKYFDRIKFEKLDEQIMEVVNAKSSETILIIKSIGTDIECLEAISGVLPEVGKIEFQFKEFLPILAKFKFTKSANRSSEIQEEFDAELSRWLVLKPRADEFLELLEKVETELQRLKVLPKASSVVETKIKSIANCREQIDYVLKSIQIQIEQYQDGDYCKSEIDKFEGEIKKIAEQTRASDSSDIFTFPEVVRENYRMLSNYSKTEVCILKEKVDSQRSKSELIASSNLLMRYMTVSRLLRDEIIFHSNTLIQAERKLLYSRSCDLLSKGIELTSDAHGQVVAVKGRLENQLLVLAQNTSRSGEIQNISFENTSYENVSTIHSIIIELDAIRFSLRDSVLFDIIDLELDNRISELKSFDETFPNKLAELKLQVSGVNDEIAKVKTWVSTLYERAQTRITLLDKCKIWTTEISKNLEGWSDPSQITEEEMWKLKHSLSMYQVIEREKIDDSNLSDALKTAITKKESDLKQTVVDIRSKLYR